MVGLVSPTIVLWPYRGPVRQSKCLGIGKNRCHWLKYITIWPVFYSSDGRKRYIPQGVRCDQVRVLAKSGCTGTFEVKHCTSPQVRVLAKSGSSGTVRSYRLNPMPATVEYKKSGFL